MNKKEDLEKLCALDIEESLLEEVVSCSRGNKSPYLYRELNDGSVYCTNNSSKILCPYAVESRIPLDGGSIMLGKRCKRYC